jgi:hypothetical protein
MKYLRLSIFLFIVAFTNCSKDERTVDIKFLTSCKWQLFKMQLKVSNPIATQYNTDTLIYPEVCDTSDYMRFFPDSIFKKYSVGKCNNAEKDTSQGSWSYNKKNQHITFSDISGKEEFQLYELINSKMVLVQEIRNEVIFKNKKYTIYTRKVFSYKGKKQ